MSGDSNYNLKNILIILSILCLLILLIPSIFYYSLIYTIKEDIFKTIIISISIISISSIIIFIFYYVFKFFATIQKGKQND